jgi:hypothetical protein|tara:strand:+ start:151 stop:540 length:390 start_codon:yes stop_codon:yes gene_type:complete
MSYKPHLSELVSDLKSNPSLIHDAEFLELKRVLETQFASTFPPKSNHNTTPKNDEEDDVDIKIEDPDIVGPELEPVDPPFLISVKEGEELSETDMNSVRFDEIFMCFFVVFFMREKRLRCRYILTNILF